ncbi:hypothetical protein Tco_1562780 [Tanacetum coccineum]
MTEPTSERYVTITQEYYISGNDGEMIVEKSVLELKGKILTKLQNKAFSGTNEEDAVEHVNKFLKVIHSLKTPWGTDDRLKISVFPVSLTGTASEWFKTKYIGSVAKWEDLTERFLVKFYPPSHTGKREVCTNVESDPDNFEFGRWLVSKFKNHEMMDWRTKNALWAYWKKGGDDEVMSEKEVPKDINSINEDEISQIFGIDTDLFHFETPLCQTLNELNCPCDMNSYQLTNGTHGIKTNEECKDDWIYERNNGIPWVDEKLWSDDGEGIESIRDVRHQCIPLRFKIGTAKWPTCNWKEDGYCNTGDLPRLIREGNPIRYESYEWYDTIEDSELEEEALKNKKILE